MASNLPNMAKINLERGQRPKDVGSDSWFDLTVNDQDPFLGGQFSAWCVNFGIPAKTDVSYIANVYSIYDPAASALVDNPDGLDNVSWLLSQDGIFDRYSPAVLQSAIWLLLDDDFSIDAYNSAFGPDLTPDEEITIERIVNAATQYGDGYMAQPEDPVLLLFDNAEDETQPVVGIAELDIEIEKYTVVNGVPYDGDNEDNPVVVNPDDDVSWEIRVTNTGDLGFAAEDITVTDSDPNITLTLVSESGVADGILSPGEVFTYEGNYPTEAVLPGYYDIDFNTDAEGNAIEEGDAIANQYEDWGLSISFLMPDDPKNPDNGLTVIDTGNTELLLEGETPYLGSDDMYVEGGDNALIMSRYKLDEADRYFGERADGGTIVLDFNDDLFADGVTVGTIDLVGLDEKFDDEGNRIDSEYAVITLHYADGDPAQDLRVDAVTDENGNFLQTVDLAQLGLEQGIEIDGITMMEVEFFKSGGITGLDYSVSYTNTADVSVIVDIPGYGYPLTDSDSSTMQVFPTPLI